MHISGGNLQTTKTTMDAIGVFHATFGVVSLVLGLSILLMPKGTRRHILLGCSYALSMLVLNATAFFIYNLFGQFGPFHVAAVIGLATLLAGLIAVLYKRPRKRWIYYHYHFMCWSYVGLVAATVAEITGRVPGWNFALAVTIPGLIVAGIGALMILEREKITIEKAIDENRKNEDY